jgi:transcription termination factor Rho
MERTFYGIQSPLRVILVQVAHRLANNKPELHLMVHLDAARPQERAGAGRED